MKVIFTDADGVVYELEAVAIMWDPEPGVPTPGGGPGLKLAGVEARAVDNGTLVLVAR